MNIVELIRQETASFAGKTAIVQDARSITYGELLDRIAALSELLLAAGNRRRPSHCISVQRWNRLCDWRTEPAGMRGGRGAAGGFADAAEVAETIERIDVNGVLTHSSLPAVAGDEAAEKIDDTFRWRPSGIRCGIEPAMPRSWRPRSFVFLPARRVKAKASSSRIARSSSAPMRPIEGWRFPSGM